MWDGSFRSISGRDLTRIMATTRTIHDDDGTAQKYMMYFPTLYAFKYIFILKKNVVTSIV